MTDQTGPLDPDLAQRLRELVSSMWMRVGEDGELRARAILQPLSKEIEQIARLVESVPPLRS
ncbi:MAG: hypothetical protein ACYDD4_12350 [Acidimicrobiales bacterium]